MVLIDKLREAVRDEKLPPIFKQSDLQEAEIEDTNYNLSNYDKRNLGSKNSKVLVSREINGDTYYSFDERVFL